MLEIGILKDFFFTMMKYENQVEESIVESGHIFLNWSIVYNVVLASGVQKSNSVTYAYTCIFFSDFFPL